MLASLSIKNYALINNLHVNFGEGFTIITGETGAGKSILLGALGLVLGKRADLSSLKDKDEKCVIEADFLIKKYNLADFFDENDLDFEKNTIIRREILPSGKSRAFINDTPVTLDILSSLGNRLIDIHSQHQTLQLTENDFQFQVIDAMAGNENLLEVYKTKFIEYQKVQSALKKLLDFQSEANKEYDYNSFLLKELREANLTDGMLEDLESKYEQLSNVEDIKEKISYSTQVLGEEQIGVLAALTELKNTLQKLSSYGNNYDEIFKRVNSVLIELDDTYGEIQQIEENLEANPGLLEEVNAKLQIIYNLQKKHNALDINELLKVKAELEEKVSVTENLDNDIQTKYAKLSKLENELKESALEIHQRRNKVIPLLKTSLENTLAELGMPNATFLIELTQTDTFFQNGRDKLTFLFSANKGTKYGEIRKVASGGELSRIMLSIKSLLAKYMNLPTIMFDEIDTGVSGEISNKMGEIMQQMSNKMQVFSITHLPQIAAKGTFHFKVYKEDEKDTTSTKIKQLTEDERIMELAEMLGGKNITDSALAHAKQLLN
ncbi:DNA repair protein RecN [Abyssalbus ytuae]|uniref:DNA repair protein RecN n=1 Tax=Abyssalbus ytuae TaxID=2926907 RepID=A0A9E7A0V1_9FLAO|nr:DNA repair protein RecN [Abyssalbus ytuae]UOB17676.1 DNA repair protein RecN [Abyssalbus ytuae]